MKIVQNITQCKLFSLQEDIVRALRRLHKDINKSATPDLAMVEPNTSQAVDLEYSNQENSIDLADPIAQQEENTTAISHINGELTVNTLPLKKRKRRNTILSDVEQQDQQSDGKRPKKVEHRRHTLFPNNVAISQQNIPIPLVKENTDKNVHSMNSLYSSLCILCDTVYKSSLVYHYANAHNEVYISRPSPEYSDRLRKSEIPFVHAPNGKISGTCCFCEKRKIFNKRSWRRHMLTHTGETTFYCHRCDISVALRRDHSDCDSKYVKCIYDLEPENDSRVLVGHICSICNYLQIKKIEIIKHLANEHKNEDGSCEKVVLVGSNIEEACPETSSTSGML